MTGPTKKKHVHMKFMKAIGGIDEAFERVHTSRAGVMDPDTCIDTPGIACVQFALLTERSHCMYHYAIKNKFWSNEQPA